MTEQVLNKMQYAELLGFDRHAFARIRREHPEQFAPSFFIGVNERWFLSTIIAHHKSLERLDNNKGGQLVSESSKK